jgi:diacylglycerol kinase family enzyme
MSSRFVPKFTVRMKSLPAEDYKFSQIILAINPQSSNIQRIKARVIELGKLFPATPIETIETSRNSTEFHTRLQKKLTAASGLKLLCIGGGDGTVNMVINGLLDATPPIDLKNVIVLPLWGGNANDFAYMLNGYSSKIRMRTIFSNGSIVPIYPLKITITNPNAKNISAYAVCYASFGASAYAADQLTKSTEDKQFIGKSAIRTIMREFNYVVRAILDAPGFDADQEGHRIKIFEQVFSNGSRMAKVDRLPVKLTDRSFYRTIRSDKPPTVMFYLLRLIRGKKLGEIREKPVRFTIKERAWAQFDGEVSILSKNTTVKVGQNNRPFYTISTKL